MSFRINVDESTDPCDVCGESGSAISPKLHLRVKEVRQDADWIFIHIHCFMAEAAKAMKRSAA